MYYVYIYIYIYREDLYELRRDHNIEQERLRQAAVPRRSPHRSIVFIIAYYIISYHIISHHIISHHIISYHIIWQAG